MLWLKQNLRITLYMLLILALGAVGGYTLRGRMQAPVEQTPTPPPPVAEPVGAVGEQSILPDTEVTIRYIFSKCGHTREEHQAGGAFAGHTQKDIIQKYPDAHVQEFKAERAVIERTLDRYCPDHVALFVDEAGNLCISQTDALNFEADSVTMLNYDTSALPEAVVEGLRQVIILDNLEQVNEYLEDVES